MVCIIRNYTTVFASSVTYQHGFSKINNVILKDIGFQEKQLNYISFSNSVIVMPDLYGNYKKPYQLSLFLPRSTSEDEEAYYNSPECLSERYHLSIAPWWILLNYSEFQKSRISQLQHKIFEYLEKNKDSLFLKQILKLKSILTYNQIKIRRLNEDFNSTIFQKWINSDLPEFISDPIHEGSSISDFKEVLIRKTKTSTKSLLNTFNNLDDIFKKISEDNITRSAVRLNKRLLQIAVTGLIITIYATNSEYFNCLMGQ